MIEITRANKRNALNHEALSCIKEMLAEVSHPETQARCLIITGEGGTFCSGADLSDTAGLGVAQGEGLGDVLDKQFVPVFRLLRQLNMPVICAMNGPAVGIGVMLALMGDIILASEKAYWKLHFSRIGLVPDGGLTYWLPKILGRHKAMEMILLDTKLNAQQAKELGLVAQVFPEGKVQEEAISLAQEIAKGAPLAHQSARRLVWNSFDNTEEQHGLEESRAQTQCGKSEDCKEGVIAFLQKRSPVFKGK